jgi:hypothetical protein
MKNKNAICHLLFLILCLFSLNIIATAQESTRRSTIFDRLTQEEVGKMTLEADFTTLIINKRTDNYYPGTLITETGKTYKVEIKSRGKFRRRIAEIPPLKVKFKKKALVAEGLDTLNEIKLVMPCYDNELGDELIVREYIAYRMFEKLSNVSLRARLVRLSLRDTHVETGSKRHMMAIVLEDEEELAARLNGEMTEEFGLSLDSMMSHQAGLMVMFQYMIGNTDWELATHRNVRLLKSAKTGRILPVPYDFDFSGLVSAPYATPSSGTGLRTVQDRFLMSSGLKPEMLKRAAHQIRLAKKDIYACCTSRYLSRDTEAAMVHYLDTFFEQLEQSEHIPTTIRMMTE